MSLLTKLLKPKIDDEYVGQTPAGAETDGGEAETQEKSKAVYIVRVDFNPNLLAKMIADGSDLPSGRLTEALGEFILEIRNNYCKSFVVFYAKAENAGECEAVIREVWGGLYPDNKNAINVVAYKYDESETTKVIDDIYCGYLGWAEYCEMTTDLAYAVPLLKEAQALKLFRSQSYLVSIDSGCGFTTLLSSYADFLSRAGFFEEKSTCYHEYKIDEREEAGETTSKDFLECLWDEEMEQQCIGVDISYYLDSEKYEELRSLLHRLYRFQEKYVFLFRIPYLEEKARREFTEVVADIIDIKTIEIEPYNAIYYEEAFDDRVVKYNMKCTEQAMELFRERMQYERRDGRFYGFKTVAKIAEQAMLMKYKHDVDCLKRGLEYDSTVMDAADIAELVPDYRKSEKSGYDELHELIGMEEIEKRIREIVAQVKLAASNDKLDRPCLHMRFTGAPGTGKTTVARIIGKIFKEENILRKGSFFEYAARSLCGKYVGQTAPKTAQVCRDAYGSVLFLDEAYALYAGSNETSENDYGREAIATLIAEMENHRDDMVVIMAGYTEDMDKLMEANAGLRSRMPFIIEFKSYSREQLANIFMKYVNKSFGAADGLEEAVRAYFDGLADSYLESKEFANARFVRNLYERTWSKAALRIAENGTSEITITVEDFNNAKSEKEFSEKLQIAKKIGF